MIRNTVQRDYMSSVPTPYVLEVFSSPYLSDSCERDSTPPSSVTKLCPLRRLWYSSSSSNLEHPGHMDGVRLEKGETIVACR